MADPELSPLARRLLEKHLAAAAPGGRGGRRDVPGHSPEEHAAAYAELVRAGYLRLGTVSFAAGGQVQNYEITHLARQLRT
jgi:hypothetical protein